MNYRHAFHAGNFADLVKHALLLAVLDRLTRGAEPLTVIDTHAGAGLYSLQDEAARRSGEAQAGVARLLADEGGAPAVLTPLIAAVRECNPIGEVQVYPGSPWLAMRALRRGDAYVGCEIRPDDHHELTANLAPLRGGAKVELLQADGYAVAAQRLAQGRGRTLLLIDPPFERADDYARVAELIAGRPDPARQPALIWTPLKDLETFDAFLDSLERAGPASLVVAQARLRPLDDPMRMNGCAVVLVDAPDVEAEARAVCGWVAAQLGGPGGGVRVERLAGAAT
nr:23S rRNA (adenine(2030)-N(6))-methyltransferase RlmJ [Caulobacter sp. S45]